MMTEPDTLTVQQVAAKTGLSEHTLRYYERIGLLKSIERAPNGHRRYAPNDIRLIEFLIKLRATGMPLEQMKEYAALIRSGDGNEADRLRLLLEHRERVQANIQALRDNLAVIEFKIEGYKGITACLNDDSVPAAQ